MNAGLDQATDTVVSGTVTSYSLVVSNAAGGDAANGAIVRDVPGAGLTNCSVTGASASGGATVPASSALAALLTTGVAIPVFPAGSQVTFTVQCTVQ